MYYRTIKYRIYPTKPQTELIEKTFSYCRKMYNLLLEDKIKYYNEHKKKLNNTPAQYKNDYPFFKEIDSLALASVQQELWGKYIQFFKTGKNFPRFKSKKYNKNYYTTYNKLGFDTIAILPNKIKLPKIKKVKAKIHQTPYPNSIIKSATIKKDTTGKYYAYILFEIMNEVPKVDYISKAIGLDYKSDGLYMDSNGNCANMPKYYQDQLFKLKKYYRYLSKKQGGTNPSNNYKKAKIKLAKLHRHIANQRKDFLHKKSTEIANQFDLVCIESISLKHIANKKLKLGIATYNNGYSLFIGMLDYKLSKQGKSLIKIDRWYPSSQICCVCGKRQKMPLNQRIYICECGNKIDRDYNASINILKEGMRLYSIS